MKRVAVDKLSEAYPVNFALQTATRELVVGEAAYHLKRRDDISDKIRFGLVGLNGASILALLSALGGSGEAAKWLGFTPVTSVISALCFTTGLVLAGRSIFSAQIIAINEAGDASARASNIGGLIALYEGANTQDNYEELRRTADDYHKLPVTGFKYSTWDTSFRHFAALSWFLGIALPLFSALDWSALFKAF